MRNPTNRATPETELIAKADAARLEAAIAALPVEFRETFVLRDMQGLDYREIAEVTATPLGTTPSTKTSQSNAAISPSARSSS
jgi:RNA polymerase sigma-70 factor (ECF subfamily)